MPDTATSDQGAHVLTAVLRASVAVARMLLSTGLHPPKSSQGPAWRSAQTHGLWLRHHQGGRLPSSPWARELRVSTHTNTKTQITRSSMAAVTFLSAPGETTSQGWDPVQALHFMRRLFASRVLGNVCLRRDPPVLHSR